MNGASKKFAIQAENISKIFPGVQALNQVSFDLYPGEIHCIVGENGAGKSTLIKILSGFLKPDRGEIIVDSQRFKALTPHQAQTLGIQVVYQENILAPTVSAAENVFAGQEKVGNFGLIDHQKTFEEAEKIFSSLGVKLDSRMLVENLSPSEQQFVKIGRALALQPRVLILDEPTAMFDKQEAEAVLSLIQDISQRGIGVIYISHRLEEIIDIAHRITVLKDGQKVACHDIKTEQINLDSIAREMVGREVKFFQKKKQTKKGKVALEIKNLKIKEAGPEVSFQLYQGEILGIAGLIGSGRTEIMKAVFGAGRKLKGEVSVAGKKSQIRNPAEAIQLGIGFITEDRQKTGLALNLSVIKNTTIVGLNKLPTSFFNLFLNLPQEKLIVQQLVEELAIKTPSLEQEIRFLSGGNQQKVILGRWLFKNVDIFIFDEPTIGIDVSAKSEIHKLMANLVDNGKSIIMISSEMPELVAMSDRVLVIREGDIVAELRAEEITEENIILHAFGVKN